jgi:hypothetical protein
MKDEENNQGQQQHRSDKAMATEGNFYLTLQSSIDCCFSPQLQHHTAHGEPRTHS